MLEPCEQKAHGYRCWGTSSFAVWVDSPAGRHALAVCGKHVTKAVTELGAPGQVVHVVRPTAEQAAPDTATNTQTTPPTAGGDEERTHHP